MLVAVVVVVFTIIVMCRGSKRQKKIEEKWTMTPVASMEELMQFTVESLRAEIAGYDLDKSGSKAEIACRIRRARTRNREIQGCEA